MQKVLHMTRVAITTLMIYYIDVIWSKIDMPDLANDHNRIIIFVWYVVKCGSKYGRQKDMRVKESGLHVQNMTTILSSIVNTIGRDLYDQLMSKNCSLDNE